MPDSHALLHWFDDHQRVLPWRSVGAPPDPYAVWISEIMLQQTRVETAIPYYRRFLARFPDVASLADAEEAEVLALWSGLGYYRRCRGLLAAAKAIVAAGGKLPASARELELLPGVGPYTAAAIASIAFSELVPVLDGNVERVLCRFAALRAGQKSRQGRSALLQLAAQLLDPLRPGDSNQALMELGATVCTPRAPDCPACPLGDGCKARALGAAESFPARARRTPGKRVFQLLAFVERDRQLLLFRRSGAAGQLAGLWEFPLVERSAERTPEALLASRYSGSWVLGAPIARLRHSITTSTFDIEVRRASFHARDDLLCEPAGGADGSARTEAGWWDIAAVGELALTGVARKVLARAGIQPG